MLNRVKGTQDFLDLTLFNFFIARAREHCSLYAFDEIATPIIEPVELFRRSLGLHTDVVSKEMYTVSATDNEDQICLRPEATASTMRAFYNNSIAERPWKVFSFGPMFRHERPQKGRFRQFHQFNLEVIGAPDVAHDAELIALLDSFFRRSLGMNSYALKLNFLGSHEDRARYKQALLAFLDEQPNLPQPIVERKETNLLRIFDLKAPGCAEALVNAPKLIDYLSDESKRTWELLQSLLLQLGVTFVIDPYLVRGLDYYNNTVFEFVSLELGAQNSFCGGGRYDYLSQTLGEKEAVPAIGAAIGIERILMILEARKDQLPLSQKKAIVAILPLSDAQKQLALICAAFLRHNAHCCETLSDITSVKSMMRRANKLGARFAIIIGEDEQKTNMLTLKDMISGTEQKVSQEHILEKLVY